LQRPSEELLAEDVEDHQDALDLAAGLRRQVGHPTIVDVRG
jgi:hypothetical protein